MRKTACTVVWEGRRAQSRYPDPFDPTCGTGGMLLNGVMELRNQGKEWRSVKLFGQEVNLLTSAIARMNMFLHDIEEFEVLRGDTLSEPKFIENDQLKQFDVIFANPPYSIKNGIATSLLPILMVVICMGCRRKAVVAWRIVQGFRTGDSQASD